MLLSDVLPEYDVRTRNSLELVAPSERVWEAIRSTTLGELRVARHLFRLRGLPSRRDRAFLELEGFRPLAEDTGRELVVGAVGQPWSPRGRLVRGADPRTFDEAGYALMALNVTYDGATLATETRVRCTDARARRRFRLYWVVVGPFSGIIRSDWLRAVARRATSRSASSRPGQPRP
jgi:hypothetical protein